LTDTPTYRRTVLDNGVRIVTENIPHVHSLAIGFWFTTGGRDEPDELAGIAHLLEHMNFKGTRRRSAGAIAREIEGRGGHLNAFTSKEATCYYARVIDEQLPRAIDVLADITLNSVFRPAEVEREQGVILEEIKSLEDTPDELVFDYFFQHLYGAHPLGRSVFGTRESLLGIDHRHLAKYRDEHYGGAQMVIAASGRLSHDRLVRMVARRLGNGAGIGNRRKPPEDRILSDLRLVVHADTQQAHIVTGCRSLRFDDPRKYTLLVINAILGGGMSSRLFQHIRERRGLAYAVYSFLEAYQDTGVFGVYAGTEPRKAERTLRLIHKELRDIVRKPVSSRELRRVKDQLKGSLMLSLESPNSRMNRLARLEIYQREWIPIEDVVAGIDAVTAKDIAALAGELFDRQPMFTTILCPN